MCSVCHSSSTTSTCQVAHFFDMSKKKKKKKSRFWDYGHLANICPKNKTSRSSRWLGFVSSPDTATSCDISGEWSDLFSSCLDTQWSDFLLVKSKKLFWTVTSFFWENSLSPSQLVSSIVNEGYSLPFLELPPPCFLTNNRSAFRNSQFV